MAVRDDFTAGEVLAAADLNDTFASKLPYSYGTATPTTTDSGFLWYDSNSTPAAPKFWDGAAFQALTSGKILQIVRATDATDRTTTSTSFVDVTGMSVTITPQKSDSGIIIIASFYALSSSSANQSFYSQLTDSSDNPLSGAESMQLGSGSFSTRAAQTLIAYSTPATTAATTYKMRFQTGSGTVTVHNSRSTGQLFAIEVSA